ncbi:MAG: hypothetical protein IKW39_02015 [Alphaproteobacteria bacterium]|nr:hypothetical protein [Alphaproteobacteria bacterium]
MQKQYITWDDIKRSSDEIAEKIKSHCQDLEQATLIAVSRGGLIPTQLISYKLNIRDIRVMKLISYDEENIRRDTKDLSTDRLFDGKTVYIIDDLADSGETIKYLKEQYPTSTICSLYTKDCCKYQPDMTSSQILSKDNWIVFPWDE